jgi:hypothetical protein
MNGMDVNVNLLKTADRKYFMDELHHEIRIKLNSVNQDRTLNRTAEKNIANELQYEIEEKLEHLDAEKLPYGKTEMIQLIIRIEECKRRFWHGDISAKRLLSEVNAIFDQFKALHPGFAFLHDSALSAYYSKGSDLITLS